MNDTVAYSTREVSAFVDALGQLSDPRDPCVFQRRRPSIAAEGGRLFQSKTAAYSSPRRPPVPVKTATDRSVATQGF